MKYLLKNKKKVVFVLILIILTITVFYCIYNHSVNHDALMIKERYESLNHEKVEGTVDTFYQNVSIKSNAAIKNITLKKAVQFLREDSGVLFIGYSECPWCRNALPVLLAACEEENMDVMYLDGKDLRDEFKVVDGVLKQTKKASKNYYELLQILDDFLDDYKVFDENKKEYDAKEKRIYVPLVVFVHKGEIVGTHMGTVELSKNQSIFDSLNKEQKTELKDKYVELIEKTTSNMCTNTGC